MSQQEYNTIKKINLNSKVEDLTTHQIEALISFAKGHGRAVRFAIYQSLNI